LCGGRIADWLAIGYGFSMVFVWGWKILQWPIVLAFLFTGFGLIYYWAPDLEDQDWRWVTPGSLVAVVLWLLVSFAFRVYLHYFDSYSKTYGSLGAVIVLMLWFYFTGAAILIGGEINSDIEAAAARQGAPRAKGKGEKNPDRKAES
ncbi:MAG: YhjD/YihY/BrkB family envelope integrity protein, partial [Acidobacteriota bacterium]